MVKTKKWPTSNLAEWVTDVLTIMTSTILCIYNETGNGKMLSICFNYIIKRWKVFTKISIQVQQKNFGMQFELVMIYTKQHATGC